MNQGTELMWHEAPCMLAHAKGVLSFYGFIPIIHLMQTDKRHYLNPHIFYQNIKIIITTNHTESLCQSPPDLNTNQSDTICCTGNFVKL
jgi:hypothetical protein